MIYAGASCRGKDLCSPILSTLLLMDVPHHLLLAAARPVATLTLVMKKSIQVKGTRHDRCARICSLHEL